jgi:hypothetical protein
MKDWARLTELLLDQDGDRVAEQGRPTWVRVLDPPGGDPVEGFALEFSGDSQGFLGWVAPPDCQAVGLIATGRLRSLPGLPAPKELPLDLPDEHLGFACLVTRAGDVAWKMRLPDAASGLGLANEPPTEGRMIDCLRRCFVLPTPPPPVSPARLQAIAWLVAVFDRTMSSYGRLTWSEVSRLHPVAQVLNTDLGGPDGDLLPGLLRLAGSAWNWEDFRQHAATHSGLDHIVEPSLADWMDEGMFARWILGELPSAEELLAAVRARLVPSAARRLAHALHETGLPEAADAMP